MYVHPAGGAISRTWQARRPARHYHNDNHERFEDSQVDYPSGGSRKERRLQELQEDGPLTGLKGAPEPDVLYLYITSVDIETSEKDLERYILTEFSNVSRARVRKIVREHAFYASFTVTVIGDNLDMEQDFLNNTEVFPKPIKVFRNRGRYNDEQGV